MAQEPFYEIPFAEVISLHDFTEMLDELLAKECYIIDFLPERVSEDRDGQFFDVEDYLLNSPKHILIKDRFVSVILKLMC